MCGVAGILNFSQRPVSAEEIQLMTDAIAHRGPDGQGVYLDGNLGLGHRRLAVIDLSEAASQPMQANDGTYSISYNGEVYNYKELRQELIAKGYAFRSNSDTEVVLKSLIEWGVDAFNKFNGMFALAFWNSKTKELILARDRYGIKPLYYHQTQDAISFASEIKALIASGRYTASIDKNNLLEYITFQNSFGPRTIFKDVDLLEAGTYLKIDPTGQLEQHRYWDFVFECSSTQNGEQATEEFLDAFSKAIKSQLVSDVPLGAYLSGGVDSGLINLFAGKERNNFCSYTIGFDLNSASGMELTFDERSRAERLSYLAKTEHYEMVLKAGDMERCLGDLVWHLEEPRIGQCYPNFYAAKLASKFGKVVLSGCGGDELFAGYPWRYYQTESIDSIDGYLNSYHKYWQRLLPAEKLQDVCQPLASEYASFSSLKAFEGVFASCKQPLKTQEDCINYALYFEAKTFLHSLLVVEDKLSMAYSLEARVPFLDNDLVDTYTKVPLSLKLRKFQHDFRVDENRPGPKNQYYFQVEQDGKMLLRKAFSHLLGDNTLDAMKQGFSAPDASWFKGESIDYVKSIVSNSNAPVFSYFDQKAVDSIFSEHLSGQKNYRLFIWSVIYLNKFMEVFKC
jgi:asparagine synthase (glutamine-hydrolysing)